MSSVLRLIDIESRAAPFKGRVVPDGAAALQSSSRRASCAMSAAAFGRARSRAASRMEASRSGASSGFAIFQAAAGGLLQRTAACSRFASFSRIALVRVEYHVSPGKRADRSWDWRECACGGPRLRTATRPLEGIRNARSLRRFPRARLPLFPLAQFVPDNGYSHRRLAPLAAEA